MPSQIPSSPPVISTQFKSYLGSTITSQKKKWQLTTAVAITTTGNTILRFLQCCFLQNTKSTPWRQDSTCVCSVQISRVTIKISETGGLMVQLILRGHVKSVTSSLLCPQVCSLAVFITFIASHKHAHELHSAIFPANSLEPCATNHICDKCHVCIFNMLSVYANSKDRTIIKSTKTVPL